MSIADIESGLSLPELFQLVDPPAGKVVKLFWQETVGRDPLRPRSDMAVTVDAILTASLQLGLAAAKLGERLDALDSSIDVLDDSGARQELKQAANLSRQQLTHSILELNARIEALPRLVVNGHQTTSLM